MARLTYDSGGTTESIEMTDKEARALVADLFSIREPYGRPSEFNVQRWDEMVRGGFSYVQVAERFGVSPRTVSKWVKRFRKGNA